MSFPSAPIQTQPNFDSPFTRNLLGTLTDSVRALPNETEAQYKDRYTAVVIAFAAYAPRDPIEQMLAAQIVAAHHAALDCLVQAMAAEDALTHARLHRIHASLNRAINTTMRLLSKAQARPADSLPPPPVIEDRVQPAPVVTAKPPQHPIRRENPRPANGRTADLRRDSAERADADLAAALTAAAGGTGQMPAARAS